MATLGFEIKAEEEDFIRRPLGWHLVKLDSIEQMEDGAKVQYLRVYYVIIAGNNRGDFIEDDLYIFGYPEQLRYYRPYVGIKDTTERFRLAHLAFACGVEGVITDTDQIKTNTEFWVKIDINSSGNRYISNYKPRDFMPDPRDFVPNDHTTSLLSEIVVKLEAICDAIRNID